MKSRNAISTVFLLAAILCSVSCGEDSAQTDAAKTETGAAGTTAEAVTEELLYKADYLPDADYNGYVFKTVTVPKYPVTMAGERLFVVGKPTQKLVDFMARMAARNSSGWCLWHSG